MRGSRLAGATIGVVLAATAGGAAVGLSSHPVGIQSTGVWASAGSSDYLYGHVSGQARDARVEVYVEDYRFAALQNQTVLGDDGYSSAGGPRLNDDAWVLLRICADTCRQQYGELTEIDRSRFLDGYVLSGHLRGKDVSIVLEFTGPHSPSEHGAHHLEPGWPAIYAHEGVVTARTLVVAGFAWGDQAFVTDGIAHNHGEQYRELGGTIEVGSFRRALRSQ